MLCFLAGIARQSSHCPKQGRDFASPGYRLRRIAAVFECVSIANRCAGPPTVHSASAVSHPGRLARLGAPRFRSTAFDLVCMGNLLCMGLIFQFVPIPTPRPLDHANHRLAARMNVDMLNNDFLLS
jgi:hypothetical protein